MILVIGLGNPGEKYKDTRHNAGFMAQDYLAKKLDGSWEIVGNSEVYSSQIGGEKVVLAKPQTFMNLSGVAVNKLMNKYDLKAEDIIVVYDEIDLPFGEVRIRKGGGTAGHNGIASITEKVGTQDFTRLRIGIGKHESTTPSVIASESSNLAPPLLGKYPRGAISEYVLQPFNPEENKKLPEILEEASTKLYLLLKFGYEEFVSKYNK